MHLCIVTETYPPEVNGVAMTLERLAVAMVNLGHRVSVVRPRQRIDRQVPPERPYAEVLVPGLPLPGYAGLQFGLPVRRRVRHRWEAERPDIVYIATEGPLGLAITGLARRLGVCVVSGYHTNFNQYMQHYRWAALQRATTGFLRWAHNRTLATFAPSEGTCEELRAAGVHNVQLFGRGVDTVQFSPEHRDPALRAEWEAVGEAPVAVYVSRMAAEKNLPLAVRAFAHLSAAEPASRGVFVGDGPERKPLEGRHPEFHYAGMRRDEELARHYASADLFIFPSLTETFGNVVTEALASGLIVVAFDYAAPRQLIRDGENGFLAEYGNEASFFATLDRALAARERWPEIRAAARATAEQISWRHVIEAFASKLESIKATANQAQN